MILNGERQTTVLTRQLAEHGHHPTVTSIGGPTVDGQFAGASFACDCGRTLNPPEPYKGVWAGFLTQHLKEIEVGG